MDAIRQTLLTNWHTMRWVRLGFGIFLAIQAFHLHDGFAAIVSAFLFFQVVTNTGCCGSSGCATPVANTKSSKTEDVHFEEISRTNSND
jgi:hypothetical protein